MKRTGFFQGGKVLDYENRDFRVYKNMSAERKCTAVIFEVDYVNPTSLVDAQYMGKTINGVTVSTYRKVDARVRANEGKNVFCITLDLVADPEVVDKQFRKLMSEDNGLSLRDKDNIMTRYKLLDLVTTAQQTRKSVPTYGNSSISGSMAF